MSFELQCVQTVKCERLSFMSVGGTWWCSGERTSLILLQIIHECPIRQITIEFSIISVMCVHLHAAVVVAVT